MGASCFPLQDGHNNCTTQQRTQWTQWAQHFFEYAVISKVCPVLYQNFHSTSQSSRQNLHNINLHNFAGCSVKPLHVLVVFLDKGFKMCSTTTSFCCKCGRKIRIQYDECEDYYCRDNYKYTEYYEECSICQHLPDLNTLSTICVQRLGHYRCLGVLCEQNKVTIDNISKILSIYMQLAKGLQL